MGSIRKANREVRQMREHGARGRVREETWGDVVRSSGAVYRGRVRYTADTIAPTETAKEYGEREVTK